LTKYDICTNLYLRVRKTYFNPCRHRESKRAYTALNRDGGEGWCKPFYLGGGEMGYKNRAEMKNFSINLNKELLKKIEELAERENRSRNNMIHRLLEIAVKNEKAEK